MANNGYISPYFYNNIFFYYSVTELVSENWRTNYYVIVEHTGMVTWAPGGRIDTSCSLDTTLFPFDRQHCAISVNTMASDIRALRLTNPKKKNNKYVWYQRNGEWDLEDFEYKTAYYMHGGLNYTDISFVLHLKRRSTYYVLNLLVPCILLSLLSCFISLVPCDAGEKINLGMVVLLSFNVLLVIIADTIPRTSTSAPLFCKYFVALNCICFNIQISF